MMSKFSTSINLIKLLTSLHFFISDFTESKLLQLTISKSETDKDESEKQFEESDFSGIRPNSIETQVILKQTICISSVCYEH
jgi:hypothetical protein